MYGNVWIGEAFYSVLWTKLVVRGYMLWCILAVKTISDYQLIVESRERLLFPEIFI